MDWSIQLEENWDGVIFGDLVLEYLIVIERKEKQGAAYGDLLHLIVIRVSD